MSTTTNDDEMKLELEDELFSLDEQKGYLRKRN